MDWMLRALNSRRAATVAIADRFSICVRAVLALVFFLLPVPWLDASYTEPASQKPSMNNEFQHFDDVQHYISVSWDHLTRSLDKCKTYEDQKLSLIHI